LSDFNQTGILRKTLVPNLTKICPVGTELFHADGQTDACDKADSHFLHFAPTNYSWVT